MEIAGALIISLMNLADMTRADLEIAIIENDVLYRSFDEPRLLAGGYSDNELRAVITEWIAAGDECAA